MLSITAPSATPSSHSISQGVVITTTTGSPPFEPATASIVVGSGSPVVFNLGGQYELSVTPLGGQRNGQTSTSIPFSTSAEFLLTVIPEPSSGLLLLAAAGVLLARRRCC